MPTQQISLDPEPPVQGDDVDICYAFDGTNETRLKVTFSPSGSSTTYNVTSGNPCVTVSVPSNATKILVEDLDGASPDKSSFIDRANEAGG